MISNIIVRFDSNLRISRHILIGLY